LLKIKQSIGQTDHFFAEKAKGKKEQERPLNPVGDIGKSSVYIFCPK